MKTIFLYLEFLIYMLFTVFKKIKVENLRKKGKLEEAEEIVKSNVKNWADFIVKKVGITIEKEGLENIPDEACVFVSNHQSFFDIPVIISGLEKPVGFIAKKEILKAKILTYWMNQIHCVFIDRSNIREAVKSINKGVQNLKEGHDMLIFPEGTRSKGKEMGEFKKGSMKLATKSKAPIVPIAIEGTYKAREANEGNKIKPAKVKLIVCPPIYSDDLTKEQKSNLADYIKEIIKKAKEK